MPGGRSGPEGGVGRESLADDELLSRIFTYAAALAELREEDSEVDVRVFQFVEAGSFFTVISDAKSEESGELILRFARFGRTDGKIGHSKTMAIFFEKTEPQSWAVGSLYIEDRDGSIRHGVLESDARFVSSVLERKVEINFPDGVEKEYKIVVDDSD